MSAKLRRTNRGKRPQVRLTTFSSHSHGVGWLEKDNENKPESVMYRRKGMKQKYNVRLGQGVLLSKIYALIERANARQLEIEDITQKMNADITSINKMIAEDKLKRQKFKKKFGL